MSEYVLITPCCFLYILCFVVSGVVLVFCALVYTFPQALMLCGSCVKGRPQVKEREREAGRCLGTEVVSLPYPKAPILQNSAIFSESPRIYILRTFIWMCCRTFLWRLIFFFFLYLSSLSAFLQQVELSFLMPGLHPSALLDYEHLKSRDRSLAHLCVYLTLKK